MTFVCRGSRLQKYRTHVGVFCRSEPLLANGRVAAIAFNATTINTPATNTVQVNHPAAATPCACVSRSASPSHCQASTAKVGGVAGPMMSAMSTTVRP